MTRRRRATLQRVAFVLGVALGALAFGLGCGHPGPDRVVLIIVDTLRADRLGVYGAKPSPSPFLDDYAARGVVFEHAFATSPWTLPSIASLLTGLDPGRHEAGIVLRTHPERAADREQVGPRSRLRLKPGVPTLAGKLSDAGFVAVAITQAPNLDPVFGLDRGFARYDHHRADNEEIQRADAVVERALGHIDEFADRKLFLVIHLFDPHLNYDAPAPFRGSLAKSVAGEYELPVSGVQRLRRFHRSLSDGEKRFIAAAYTEEVRFVDEQIGVFVDGLEQRGVLDDTMLVLTADHGEEFFEHGGFEHGHSGYNELLHVPLIIWEPGGVPRREPAAVSIVDVAATILDAVGVETGDPPDGAGRSLRASLDPRAPGLQIAEGTLYGPELKVAIRWPFKLIWDPRRDRHELYDLAVDPGEQRPRNDPKLASELREALEQRLVDRASTPPRASEPARLDAELERDLRALGYAE